MLPKSGVFVCAREEGFRGMGPLDEPDSRGELGTGGVLSSAMNEGGKPGRFPGCE
jgi:hypothetical protein